MFEAETGSNPSQPEAQTCPVDYEQCSLSASLQCNSGICCKNSVSQFQKCYCKGSFSSRYTGERCERLVPSKAGLDRLWALLGISILLVAILTILLTRKKHRQNEHADEQNAVESEQIELDNRNSENLIPE